MELCDLVILEGKDDLAVCALLSDNVEKAQADVLDAVLAVEHSGDGESGIHTAEQALANVADRDGDRVEGRALTADNACTRLADVVLDLFLIEGGVNDILAVAGVTELIYRNVGDIHERPRNEGRISVLAKDVSVNVTLIYRIVFGETRAEAGGVEDSTRTDNAFLGDSRILCESVGENVNGVADDEVCGVGSIASYLGNDALDDIDVGLSEIESRLAGLSGDTRRNNYYVGALGVGVFARIYCAGIAEGSTLADIQRLAHSSFLIYIYHNDFVCDAVYGQGVCDSSAYVACSYNSDLGHSYTSFFGADYSTPFYFSLL